MTTWDTPPTGTWGHFAWRRQNLLDEIREQGGQWTTGRVKRLYRQRITGHIYRHNIRRDLAHLHDEGHLTRHGDGTPRRYYTLCQEGATS
jgi:DeoR/GlpR family transcriptional regulator of sugar metabolism